MERHIEMFKALRRLPRLFKRGRRITKKCFKFAWRKVNFICGRKGRAVMDIRDKVIEIIAQQAVLEVSDITMDSTLESLGIESLGLVESIFAIEEAFDIQIPFNANEPTEGDFDISSVSSIIADIEKIMVQQS